MVTLTSGSQTSADVGKKDDVLWLRERSTCPEVLRKSKRQEIVSSARNIRTAELPTETDEEEETVDRVDREHRVANKFYGEVIDRSATEVHAWIEVAPSLRIRTSLPISLFSEFEPMSGVRFLWFESPKGIDQGRVDSMPESEPTPEDVQEIERLSLEFRQKWANKPLPLDEDD